MPSVFWVQAKVFAPTMWINLPVAIADSPENSVKLAALVVEQEDWHPDAWHRFSDRLILDMCRQDEKTREMLENGVDPDGAHPFLMCCT